MRDGLGVLLLVVVLLFLKGEHAEVDAVAVLRREVEVPRDDREGPYGRAEVDPLAAATGQAFPVPPLRL